MVTTQVYRFAPLKSVMIFGRAVPTMVWSSAPRKRASMIARMIPCLARFESSAPAGAGAIFAAAGRRVLAVGIWVNLQHRAVRYPTIFRVATSLLPAAEVR